MGSDCISSCHCLTFLLFIEFTALKIGENVSFIGQKWFYSPMKR